MDAKGVETCALLVVTTADAGDNGISIDLGSAATTIDGIGADDTITVDATNLDQDTVLTLDGASDVVVSALVGAIDAKTGDLTGTLDVTTADAGDNGISIDLGSAATTIDGIGADDTITVDATELDQDTVLTLDGASDVVVSALVGAIDAKTGDLTGTLDVTTADAGDNGISIDLGSAATTIDGIGADDTITVDATELDQDTVLTLDGASDVVVSALVGDIDAKTGDLTGTLDVTTADAGDNGISIDLGSAATTSDGSGAYDTITVDATELDQDTVLTLDGAS